MSGRATGPASTVTAILHRHALIGPAGAGAGPGGKGLAAVPLRRIDFATRRGPMRLLLTLTASFEP